MPLANAVVSALLQVAVLGAVPSLLYWVYHRIRFRRSLKEVAGRLGLVVGQPQYIFYALLAVVALVIVTVVGLRATFETFVREGLAQRQFAGVGITVETVVAALLWGGLQTGFSEELLFRGLIAGSLARRLPLLWANVVQALVFSLVHLPILFVAPELWGFLAAVFAVALFMGWLRIQSGSILGPWLLHAGLNVTAALLSATQGGL